MLHTVFINFRAHLVSCLSILQRKYHLVKEEVFGFLKRNVFSKISNYVFCLHGEFSFHVFHAFQKIISRGTKTRRDLEAVIELGDDDARI